MNIDPEIPSNIRPAKKQIETEIIPNLLYSSEYQ